MLGSRVCELAPQRRFCLGKDPTACASQQDRARQSGTAQPQKVSAIYA
jgi:hypothetical protein